VAAIFVQFADPATRSFMFERIVRALKPNGVLLLQGYTPKQLEYKTGGPPYVENLYTAELLRSAFAALEVLELREHERILGEGTQHCGRSALIDLVARKPTSWRANRQLPERQNHGRHPELHPASRARRRV
jgi:hypothetical protein